MLKIFEFYINSNLHVALAGFAFTKITLLKVGSQDWKTPLFVMFSIILSYNFIRLYEYKTNNLPRLFGWFHNNIKAVVWISVISFFALIYISSKIKMDTAVILMLLPFVIITFFYIVPFYKNEKKIYTFRAFPFLKIFSISITWGVVTVLFPLVTEGVEMDYHTNLAVFQRILLVLVITLPFDIRDVKIDPKPLKTIPQTFGVLGAKIVGLILLIGAFLMEVLFFENSNMDLTKTVLIFSVIGLFLFFTNEFRSRFYTSFWIEAIPIFWYLVLLF